MRRTLLAATAALSLFASAAGAIPGSTQNPDGSWTGPNGEDLGGGAPAAPEPKASPREGSPSALVQCGCGYVVRLRDGLTAQAARQACERDVRVQECGR